MPGDCTVAITKINMHPPRVGDPEKIAVQENCKFLLRRFFLKTALLAADAADASPQYC